MSLVAYKTLEAVNLGKLPVRSIDDLEWIMSEGLYVQLFSADGQRSVDVRCDLLLEAMNACAVLAQACGLDATTLGEVLDQADIARRHPETIFAQHFVASHIPDAYWRPKLAHIIELAPEGSGTREALRYLLATVELRDVLY
ncbi:hypothetical protein [Castellaniella caeni]|uniref:hypothetical protein n=1 Tax=Castellaniella caeni TaxID=266123 RepID=UPI00082C314A|nr:hypothetical protein [Castellaniella caeni]